MHCGMEVSRTKATLEVGTSLELFETSSLAVKSNKPIVPHSLCTDKWRVVFISLEPSTNVLGKCNAVN